MHTLIKYQNYTQQKASINLLDELLVKLEINMITINFYPEGHRMITCCIIG